MISHSVIPSPMSASRYSRHLRGVVLKKRRVDRKEESILLLGTEYILLSVEHVLTSPHFLAFEDVCVI